MFSLSRHRGLAPALAPVVAAALLTGCMKWSAVAPTPEAFAGAKTARVTLHTGTTLQVNNPSVQGDSLIGFAQYSSARVAYAVKDVAMVEVSRSDGAMTAMLVLGLLVAVVAASVLTCSLSEQGCV